MSLSYLLADLRSERHDSVYLSDRNRKPTDRFTEHVVSFSVPKCVSWVPGTCIATTIASKGIGYYARRRAKKMGADSALMQVNPLGIKVIYQSVCQNGEVPTNSNTWYS